MDKDHLLDSDYSTSLGITPEIRSFLSETARWANFLAIVGFIFIGLIAIIALFAGSIFGSVMSQVPSAGPGAGLGAGFITTMYLIIAVIYFFPTLYLYRFANKMKMALSTDDQMELSTSFENLKSMFKFMGILMIIILGFYALGILMAIVGGLSMM